MSARAFIATNLVVDTLLDHLDRRHSLEQPALDYPIASIPCPCGSGVIEDDCTCEDSPVRCETCWYEVDECDCEQDDAETRYVDSLDAADLMGDL